MAEEELNTFLTKLPVEDKPEFIILHTSWNADSIRFQIIDISKKENNEWTGDLLIEDLKTSAVELGIPFEEFLSETKQALSKVGGLEKFSYAIEDSKFIWRKKEKFKIVYGEVILLPTENLKDRIILESIDVISKLRDDYQQLRFDFQKQNVEFEAYVESYYKCIKTKDSLERNLLTKFCALLNSKKDKIAELQELLREKESISAAKKNGDDDNNSNLNQQEDEVNTQNNAGLNKKGLLLPKRKKIIEAQSNAMERYDYRNKPSCSRAANNIEENECDNFDIFDNL